MRRPSTSPGPQDARAYMFTFGAPSPKPGCTKSPIFKTNGYGWTLTLVLSRGLIIGICGLLIGSWRLGYGLYVWTTAGDIPFSFKEASPPGRW